MNLGYTEKNKPLDLNLTSLNWQILQLGKKFQSLKLNLKPITKKKNMTKKSVIRFSNHHNIYDREIIY